MEDDGDMRHRVDDMTTRSFSIAGCPVKVFDDFVKYCEENAKVTKIFYQDGKRQIKEEVCYSIGLKQLLDAVKADAKNQMLFDRIQSVELQLMETKGVQQDDKGVKTFGKSEVKKDGRL